MPRFLCLCGAAVWLFLAAAQAIASEQQVRTDFRRLNLYVMVSGGEQRKIYYELLARFSETHPDINVESNEYVQAVYKENIEHWIKSDNHAPDVMFWFGGRVMNDLYQKGLVRPIGDLWESEGFDEQFAPAIRDIVALHGEPMGVPISYYHWGIYYRKSLFDELDLKPPATWDELLAAGEAMKEEGIFPFILGAKTRWPAAGWFDYLNLRINGLEFHNSLLAGEIAFDSPQVRRAVDALGQLVERDFFLPGLGQLSWRSALPFLYQKQAGMMLMGGFVVPQFPEQIMDDIGVFRFPMIDPSHATVENAPTDVFFMPSSARHEDEAKAFLAFVASAETQHWLNTELGTIAPNLQTPEPQQRLIREGSRILRNADGVSQFFDRQTPRSFSNPAMDALVRFMERELTSQELVLELEQLRQQTLR